MEGLIYISVLGCGYVVLLYLTRGVRCILAWTYMTLWLYFVGVVASLFGALTMRLHCGYMTAIYLVSMLLWILIKALGEKNRGGGSRGSSMCCVKEV